MEKDEFIQIHKQIINNAKLLIDRNIYKFLFKLFYNILLKTNKSFPKDQLNNMIEYINTKYIKIEENKINTKLENKNFNNILKFVKTQNTRYAGEIIENILIIIFSFAFNASQEDTFGKYIYNNIFKFQNREFNGFTNWFINGKLNDELADIKNLLKNDYLPRNRFEKYEFQEFPLYEILYGIYLEECIYKKAPKKKIMNLINRRNFDFYNKIIYQKFNPLKDKNTTNDQDVTSYSNSSEISNMYFGETTIYGEKVPIPIGKKKNYCHNSIN